MAAADQATVLSPRKPEILDRVTYRLAETEGDREAIYSLRYRAYLKEGAIGPNADKRNTDRYDDMPNTWVFGVYVDDELASSIRVSVAMPDHPTTPSVDVFRDILAAPVESGKVIVDPTKFVADPVRAKRFPELPYVTVRLGYIACSYFDADIGLATVRAEHRAFYRRVFLQEPLSEPRLFPGLLKPVGLMAANYRQIQDRVFARFPLMQSSSAEQRALFGHSGAQLQGIPRLSSEQVSIVPVS